jgi:WD40 repeat protein
MGRDTTAFEQTTAAAGTVVNSAREVITESAHFVAHEETVNVLDPATGAAVRSLERFDAGLVTGLAVFENQVAVGYSAGFVSIFDATTGDLTAELLAFSNEVVAALAFSEDGTLLAYGSRKGQLRIVDMITEYRWGVRVPRENLTGLNWC